MTTMNLVMIMFTMNMKLLESNDINFNKEPFYAITTCNLKNASNVIKTTNHCMSNCKTVTFSLV
jgi:hypothetical protein